MKRVAFSLLLGVTLVVAAVMVGWSIPTLQRLAGGAEIFDMRSTGYSLADAQAILTALGPAGAAFYAAPQHVLDTALPPLLALTLFFAIAALAPPRLGPWKWLVAALTLPAAPLDLMENHMVDVMLAAGPANVTAEMAATGSTFTVLKFVALGIAFVLLAVFAAMRILHRRRRA